MARETEQKAPCAGELERPGLGASRAAFARYSGGLRLVELRGIEPLTSAVRLLVPQQEIAEN
jgi:hypothetical protein